jgi:Flp pilus assembly pilin Flp
VRQFLAKPGDYCEKGQDLVEYSLLVSLIAAVAVIGIKIFGQDLLLAWESLAARLPW